MRILHSIEYKNQRSYYRSEDDVMYDILAVSEDTV